MRDLRWTDIEDDLRRVLQHPGFVELSNWPEFDAWKLGIRLGVGPKDPENAEIAWGRISWFSGASLPAALTQAVCALERLGAPVRIAEEKTHYRCEGCGEYVDPDPLTPDGRGHDAPNEDGSPGYCGPISVEVADAEKLGASRTLEVKR